jgi:hypothetical protein
LHDKTTRAQRLCRAAALAAFLLLSAGAPPALAAETAHPIAIEIVQPGREGLELTARLSPEGGIIGRNISWTVRRADGTPVYESEAGSVDISVPPGDYVVEAAYGAANLSQSVSLPPGSRIVASFILNAGGLSVAARLGDSTLPKAAPRIRVFALSEGKADRLVALSVKPGEIIRLPQGRYRVESLPAQGNAVAVADVDVKAGRVSTLDITHKASLARLSFVGSPSASVRWDIEDAKGRRIAEASGLNANLLLVPGTYTARATVGRELLTATFLIAAGETRDILLGN